MLYMDLGVNIVVLYDKPQNLTEWLFCPGHSQIVGVSHTGSSVVIEGLR